MKIVLAVLLLVAVIIGLALPTLPQWTAHNERTDPPMLDNSPTSEKIVKTDEEWKKILTPEQYEVTRKKGTECAFTGAYWNTKDKGMFVCVCCGQELFHTDTKFNSGTGWPSFFKPTKEENIAKEEDNSHFMRRVEVLCSRCDAHLGHVFEDGPPPTRLRYCINSAAIRIKPDSDSKDK